MFLHPRGRLRALRSALPRATAAAIARTKVGELVADSVLVRNPRLAIEIVGPLTNRAPRFGNVTAWPETLAHFDDLAFLFASNQLNHAIALLSFREAAYLYRLAQKVEAGILVEIGRFKGGGTLVLAAGMGRDSLLYSYDLHTKLTGELSGSELDEEARRALERYGLAERVRLIVADSASAEIPGACELVFVDGDHTYAGVRADYEHWRDAVVPGGHLLFHDAVPTPFGPFHEEVARLLSEIEREDRSLFERVESVDSLAHFIRR